VVPPEGFFVPGTQSPLKEGELERAAGWATSLAELVQQPNASWMRMGHCPFDVGLVE
jgi:hypothetical protein